MKFNKSYILFFILIIFSSDFVSLWGQSDIKIGRWRSHLSYRHGYQVTQNKEKVFYVSDLSIVSIDKDELVPKFYSKIDGLSDIDAKLISYDESNEALIVVYDNSNLDVIFEDRIININDILNNILIAGNRSINSINVVDSTKVYFAANFGIVELDIPSLTFGFTCFTSFPVYDIALLGDEIWASTEDGIYKTNRVNNTNIAFFGGWDYVSSEYGLTPNYVSGPLTTFNGDLYASIDSTVHVLSGDSGMFNFFHELENFHPKFFDANTEDLIIGYSCNAGCNGKVLYIDTNGEIVEDGWQCVNRPNGVVRDEQGRYWYADDFPGIRFAQSKGNGCNFLDFNRVYSSRNFDIEVVDDVVYVGAGGVTSTYSYQQNRDGIYILRDGFWEVYNERNNDELKELNFIDFLKVLPHPTEDKITIATYWKGILEYDYENWTNWHLGNSSLQTAQGDAGRTRISDMKYDKDGNLWLLNYLALEPLSVFTKEGVWKSFNLPGLDLVRKLDIDENGFIWIVINQNGVVVYDPGTDILSTDDDRSKHFKANNSILPLNDTRSVKVDLEGDVWVGTADGAIVFECGSSVFEENCTGSRRKVVQDGIPAYLLETEIVQTIEVDGANRKWFGTTSGIYVQSPNGDTQVTDFNTRNSPLPDDNIIDLAINQSHGEVWVGTGKGIFSYRTDAIEGTNFHREPVYAFPNPVRPGYNGPIAIKGLARNANVKITDIHGHLVFETRALGGQAIWEGNDLSGNRATTGVYLVFSTSDDPFGNLDTYVTKILFVN